VVLLPGDFPMDAAPTARSLRSHGVSVDRIAESMQARSLNVLFFAGCRTLVLDE
jgi:hypothetical protein